MAEKRGEGPHSALVAAGRRPEWVEMADGRGVANPPVWRGSTVLFPGVADLEQASAAVPDRLFYGRKGTPTAWALADAMTALEPGAAGTVLYPSGVAALVGAILAAVRPDGEGGQVTGAHVLVPDSAYGPTTAFAFDYLAPFGVEAEAYPPTASADDVRALFRAETRLLVLESPGSQTFEVQDVPGLAGAAREAGVATLLDNSWAASWFFKGIPAGCDLVMQAITKYVGGHSDLLMGAVSATPDWFPRLRRTAMALGQCVSPDDAALALRGFRTLGIRLERAGATALEVARHLARHPLVEQVIHPAFPDCPGHAFFARDFSGSSGLFAFALKRGTLEDTANLCDGRRYFGIGYSWGGYESLLLPTAPERMRRRPTARHGGPLIRIAIGLEDAADLMADLDEGLARYGAAVS